MEETSRGSSSAWASSRRLDFSVGGKDRVKWDKAGEGQGPGACACVGVWALGAGTPPGEPDSAFTLVVEGGAVGDPVRAPCLWWPSDQGFVWKHRAKQGRGPWVRARISVYLRC